MQFCGLMEIVEKNFHIYTYIIYQTEIESLRLIPNIFFCNGKSLICITPLSDVLIVICIIYIYMI